jgi:hypothetical protein
MAQPSTTLQTTYSFFHSNNKTLSEETQYLFESQYSGGHVVFTKDVMIDPISYCPTVTDADNFVAANPTILRKYTQTSLTQVPNSNGQSWYINDAGNGGWQKPIIVGSLIPQAGTNLPSTGFDPLLYTSASVQIATTAGVWWVDPFQGILKFANGYTPSVMGWGTPKITAYAYIGRKLQDYVAEDDPATTEYVYNNVTESDPTSVTYSITHNLNSYNLLTEILANDTEAGGYMQQLAPVVLTGLNTASVLLTEATDVIVIFKKVNV